MLICRESAILFATLSFVPSVGLSSCSPARCDGLEDKVLHLHSISHAPRGLDVREPQLVDLERLDFGIVKFHNSYCQQPLVEQSHQQKGPMRTAPASTSTFRVISWSNEGKGGCRGVLRLYLREYCPNVTSDESRLL